MGLLIATVALLAFLVIAAGAQLPHLAEAPAMFMVLIPVLAFAAGGGSLAQLKQIGLLFIRNTPLTDRRQLRALYATLVMMAELSIYLGLLGTLIGSVLIMQNVSAARDLPPAMAVNILTLLYGLIFYLIFRVAAARVRRTASRK